MLAIVDIYSLRLEVEAFIHSFVFLRFFISGGCYLRRDDSIEGLRSLNTADVVSRLGIGSHYAIQNFGLYADVLHC